MNPFGLGSILVNVISPIALSATLGAAIGRLYAIDAWVLSRVTLYILTPSLVFTSAYRSKLGTEFAEIAAFVLMMTAAMGLVTIILVKLMRYQGPIASAFGLSVIFGNAGNYGLPLVLFAFGTAGMDRAVVFFTVGGILGQTLAVFIAARATKNTRNAIASIFKLPLVYAVTAGLILNRFEIPVPEPIMKTLDLMSNGAVPMMLILLGIELS